MHAARLNDLKMLKLLLNPHSYKHKEDETPWSTNYSSWTRGKGSADLDLQVQCNKGWTVVDYVVCPSIEKGSKGYSYANVEPLLTILHKSGSSFSDKSGDGLSPIERAVQHQNPSILKVIYKILKTPISKQLTCSPFYGKEKHILKENFPSIPQTVGESARKMISSKEGQLKPKNNKVLPDPLLKMEEDNAEVVMDTVQDIYMDCLLTKVDICYGMTGLYNFYKMQVVKQPRGKQLVVLFTEWGRVGMEGQHQETPFPTEEEAINEFKKIFKAKTGNGWDEVKNFQPKPKRYRLIHKDVNATMPSEITVDFEKLEKSEKPHLLNQDVYQIIKSLTNAQKLVKENESTYRRFGSTFLDVSEKLPIISTEALKKADAVLTKIKSILAEKHKMHYEQYTKNYSEEERIVIFNQLVEASEEFYSLVPVYGFEYDKLDPIFEFRDLHERQAELYHLIHIGFAKELLLAAEYNISLCNPFEYVYRNLETKLSLLDLSQDDENYEAQIILQYINATSPKTKVEGIFRIQGAEDHELSEGNRHLLWHGTKSENVLSILHSGLQIAPLGVDRMGELFGKGIYFADTFGKSESYSFDHNQGSKKSKFIFLCEVALGKVHPVKFNNNEVNNPGTERTLPNGCDSSKTSDSRYIPDPAGLVNWNGKTVPLGPIIEQVFPDDQYPGLNNNEYILFNPKQVKLRYLIQFK